MSPPPYHIPLLSTLQDLYVVQDGCHGIAQQTREPKGGEAVACIVQWSPWDAMKDCYKSFCCVENAKFGEPATVQPGDSWRATQDLAVIDL